MRAGPSSAITRDTSAAPHRAGRRSKAVAYQVADLIDSDARRHPANG